MGDLIHMPWDRTIFQVSLLVGEENAKLQHFLFFFAAHLQSHQQQMGMRAQQQQPQPQNPPHHHHAIPPPYQQQQQQHVAPPPHKQNQNPTQAPPTASAELAALCNNKDGRGSPPAVDSWEDIADDANETSREQSHPTESAESAKVDSPTASTKSQEVTKIKENSTTGSTERLAVDSKTVDAEAATSSSSSIGSTGSSSRKIPSPNLMKSAKSDTAGKPSSTLQPPPKTKDDKENLNVIFIGHVGEWIYF